MSMAIPSCLLQLEKTAINSWDVSDRISMQQFRLCYCVMYTHYHSFVMDQYFPVLIEEIQHLPLCYGFNLTRVNTNLTFMVSHLSNCNSTRVNTSLTCLNLVILVIQDFIAQFDKLIQHNVNGNISKLVASIFLFFL